MRTVEKVRLIMAVRVAIWEFIAMAAAIFVCVFAAWLIETTLTDIPFGKWLQLRWYLVLGFFLLISYSWYSYDREDADLESSLFQLGVPYRRTEHGEFDSKLSNVGAIEMDDKLLGPFVVDANRNGILLSRERENSAFFEWSRLRGLSLVTTKTGSLGLRADFRVGNFGRTFDIVFPWKRELNGLLSRSDTKTKKQP